MAVRGAPPTAAVARGVGEWPPLVVAGSRRTGYASRVGAGGAPRGSGDTGDAVFTAGAGVATAGGSAARVVGGRGGIVVGVAAEGGATGAGAAAAPSASTWAARRRRSSAG